MYIPLFKGSNTPFQSAWPYCTEKFQGGIFLVYIIRSYPCVMSTGVVFALVVWKIFHPGLSLIQKHLLFIFFTCPEILHFHCTQSLLFNGVICDANGGWVVTMYQYWWYCMVKIFEGCLKNHPFLEIQKMPQVQPRLLTPLHISKLKSTLATCMATSFQLAQTWCVRMDV